MRYNLKILARTFLDEHPEWKPQEATEHAVVLRRELHRLNKSWWRSQRRFHEKNILYGTCIEDPGYVPESDEPEVEPDV